MPETLTESFCERCGTRYEFQAPTRLNPLRKTRGLVSGFKNYLLSQDALSDSIGDAMRVEEQDLASAQLEAFHAAFNFCINCRQYACNNCWNEDAGRCRTCVPIPGTDDLVERMEAAFRTERGRAETVAPASELEMDASAIQRRLGAEAWPTSDLPADGDGTVSPSADPYAQGTATGTAPPPELATPGPAFAARGEPPPPQTPSEYVGRQVAPWSPVADELMPSATPEPVSGFDASQPEVEFAPILGWEPDSARMEAAEPLFADEVSDGEREPRAVGEGAGSEPGETRIEAGPAVEAEALVEPVTPAAAEVEPSVKPRFPGPQAAPEPEAEAPAVMPPTVEPTPLRPRLTPLSETFVRRRKPTSPIGREPVPSDNAVLAARRAQLELLGLEDPGVGKVETGQRPVLAYRSTGAPVHPGEIAARSTSASGAPSPLWDASAREVAAALSAVAVQSCGSCGLSLSATARFCRRCGASQARSA
jgi:hypothetical protein